jgi:4-hydroxy 2-oxovalerate aldolase
MEFNNIKNTQIFCLVGNEGHRMEDVFSGNLPDEAICISPPYPRKMGTYIPEKLEKMAFELNDVKFSDKYLDSHTALALETCYDLKVSNIWLVGYDGYGSGNLSQREQELFYENEYLFNMAKEHGMDCESLTATSYKNLVSQSVFSYI